MLSAPDAGISAGPGWFAALVEAVRTTVPAAKFETILDCRDDAGAAMAAIRAGVEAAIFTGRGDIAERLAESATAQNCRLLTERLSPSLDLGTLFFADDEALRCRCAEFLAGSQRLTDK